MDRISSGGVALKAVLVVVLCGRAFAQDEQTTSATDPRLKRMLARNPAADANKDGVLTAAEARAFRRAQAGNPDARPQGGKWPPPSEENVAYGPHERNVLDFWKAESEKPTPVLVYIHGGGFVNGDKSRIRGNPAVQKALDAGVSFASINYRFREHAPIQDILRDAARAIQFLRTKANEWNIDPERIASYGGSAGAGTSLWLAFHDDLADPNASDPVLRQSSRLTAAGALNGQASYDLRDWDKIVGSAPMARSDLERNVFYGFKTAAEAETPEADRIMKDCSMWSLITKDDPPVALFCAQPNTEPKDRGHYVHHPKHAIVIADRAKENGVEALLVLRDDVDGDRVNGEGKVVEFLLEKLTASESKEKGASQ